MLPGTTMRTSPALTICSMFIPPLISFNISWSQNALKSPAPMSVSNGFSYVPIIPSAVNVMPSAFTVTSCPCLSPSVMLPWEVIVAIPPASTYPNIKSPLVFCSVRPPSASAFTLPNVVTVRFMSRVSVMNISSGAAITMFPPTDVLK